MRQQCVGGPLDGTVATAAPGRFRYLDARGHAWRTQGEGRWLYVDLGIGSWEWLGHGARKCSSCGSFVPADTLTGQRLEECPLCGAEVQDVRGDEVA